MFKALKMPLLILFMYSEAKSDFFLKKINLVEHHV